MSQAGLSFEQAPPLGAPLRLFLIAPWFLIAAALAAIPLAGDWTANRWTPAALGLTHLLTLGFLGTAMAGALLQMLPVMIGSPLPKVRPVAWLAYLGLALGSPLLAAGLAFGLPALLDAGLIALSIAWLPFLAAGAASLARAPALAAATRAGMRHAWLGLAVAVGLGLYLGGGLTGLWPLHRPIELTRLHAAWGLLGWVLMLIVGVAYHVVPMLQLTPPYPAGMTRWLTPLLFASLIVYSMLALLPGSPIVDLAAWLALGAPIAWFAFATLRIQNRRRRKLPDVTHDFWRLAMACLLLGLALAPMALFAPEPRHGQAQVTLGLAFILGFAVTVVAGMLYKIVPFLAWFHLQAQTQARAGTIPNMKEMIPDAAARRHLKLHATALLLILPAPWLPAWLSAPGLLLLAASGYALWRNLHRARRLFLQYGGRLG
ncbi:MAG: hypothetical protein HY850_07735 [Betaproteobacteria bacterium]|nr:hypothetical protein [Betaproteobacteria bacterium]